MSKTRGASNDGSPRPCRAYRARTVSTVRRALGEWAYIFGCPAPSWSPSPGLSCMQLAAEVKGLLGACPSTSQEEIFAWQSIKKLLPNSCSCMERPLVEGVVKGFARPRRDLPPGYLAFLRKETRRLFRKGWDTGLYEERVLTCSPSLSGTLECPRSQGGCGGSGLDHASFIDACLSGTLDERPVVEAELLVVQSAGKPRPLTKFSSDTLCLKPLHTSIYDHLRSQRWLSVGDVRSEVLERAGFKASRGGELTSGDYKGATDGLSIEAAEVILETILEGAICVSPLVRAYALASLRPLVGSQRLGIGQMVPRIGQMMGSFLSFPLLCLQNRFAFLWAVRSAGLDVREAERLPCLINGDDILFQSDRKVSDEWMAVVSSLGLEVERTKTSVSPSYGSLNSTLLRWSGNNLRVVPTFRFGRLRSCDFVTSLAREFSQWLCASGSRRFRAAIVFFRRRVALMRSTRLTLLELGFRGSLAQRMAELFSLVPNGPCSFKPPPAPVGHNIVLRSDEVTLVPEEELGAELLRENARETAAWKFRQEFSECRSSAALQYAISMSRIRRPEPVCGPVLCRWGGLWRHRSPVSVTEQRRIVSTWFAQPLGDPEKGVPVFDSILDSQFVDFRPPPSYQESVGSECPSLAGVAPEIPALFPEKK
nr:MAG: RNA-dependent RNA polymerase [Botourmiaviridae sp.]